MMRNRIKDWFMGKLMHILGCVDELFYSPMNWIANRIILLRHPERVAHPGTLHPDKTFYIIRDLPASAGLASWLDRVVGYCMRAERKGWIPIIVPNPPAQEDSGTWYDFFKGLIDIPVEEALQGKNVVNATVQGMIYKRYNRKNIKRRNEVYSRIALSDRAQEFVNARLPELMKSIQAPTVAVRYRGTDYRAKGKWCPIGHATVPDVPDFIAMVEKDFAKWELNSGAGENIFFMTEEQEALDAFLRRFPRCHYLHHERFANFDYDKPNNSYICFHHLPNTSPLENDLNYLLEMQVVSRCDYLIGGYNGAVLAACNYNGNKYKGVHILKTGVS